VTEPPSASLLFVLPRTYDEQVCSLARALEVLGDRWTLLILRDAFQRIRRFHDFEQSLGLSKHVLSERLDRLVAEGILARRRYQERPERYEYVLTAKGRGLWRSLLLLTLWGDEHYPANAGKPRIFRHRGCGGPINDRFHCERCDKELEREELELALGPALETAGRTQRYPWRVTTRA
jgi:DNA-binding HxlR family transcriptional regulator